METSVCAYRKYTIGIGHPTAHFYPLFCVVGTIWHAARSWICAWFLFFVFRFSICFQSSASSCCTSASRTFSIGIPPKKNNNKSCPKPQIIIVIIDKTKFGKKGFQPFVLCVRRVFACWFHNPHVKLFTALAHCMPCACAYIAINRNDWLPVNSRHRNNLLVAGQLPKSTTTWKKCRKYPTAASRLDQWVIDWKIIISL